MDERDGKKGFKKELYTAMAAIIVALITSVASITVALINSKNVTSIKTERENDSIGYQVQIERVQEQYNILLSKIEDLEDEFEIIKVNNYTNEPPLNNNDAAENIQDINRHVTPNIESAEFLGYDLKPYQTGLWVPHIPWYTYQDTVLVGGKTYKYANIINPTSAYSGKVEIACFNLEAGYKMLKGLYGHVDGSSTVPLNIEIFGDGKMISLIEAQSNSFGESFEMSVEGIKELKIICEANTNQDHKIIYALFEVEMIK